MYWWNRVSLNLGVHTYTLFLYSCTFYMYGKCPKILYTKVADKMSYANSKDLEGAVWSGSVLFDRCSSSSLCLKPYHNSSALGSHGRTSVSMTFLSSDLLIIAESLEECVRRLLTWKEAMEKKGLRVNVGKTKIMICGTDLDLLQNSGEFPWSQTSIVCSGMIGHWSDRSAMSGRKTLSMSYLHDLALRIWTSFWRREGSAGMDMERSSGATFHIQVERKCGPRRPKMTWKQLTKRDCREWKLLAINPHDRHTWRSGVRSAMHAASQLSGRGPTDVDVAPVPAR